MKTKTKIIELAGGHPPLRPWYAEVTHGDNTVYSATFHRTEYAARRWAQAEEKRYDPRFDTLTR